jgi:phage tail-like protein
MTGTQPNLIDYLPAIYQENVLLQDFLSAFQDILLTQSENPESSSKALETTIDRIDSLFLPGQTPKAFLTWLADWVALTLREDWTETQKRQFLQQIVPLYQKRGTPIGLKEMLEIYVSFTSDSSNLSPENKVEILDFPEPFLVGDEDSSRVGIGTVVGEAFPYYFYVRISLSQLNALIIERIRIIVPAILNQEKPAHTYYSGLIQFPTLQVGVRSTIGIDTLIGTTLEISSIVELEK